MDDGGDVEVEGGVGEGGGVELECGRAHEFDGVARHGGDGVEDVAKGLLVYGVAVDDSLVVDVGRHGYGVGACDEAGDGVCGEESMGVSGVCE